MFQDHEKTKNISQAIQSIILSIAVLAGGCWTAWVFYKLDSIEKSKADLIALQNAADQKAVINIRLVAEDERIDDMRIIKIKATLTNTGKKDAYLNYDTPVLTVTRVELTKDGEMSYSNLAKLHIYMPTEDQKIGKIPDAVIRDGEAKEYPFVVPMNRAGIYLIRFVAKVSNQDKRQPTDNDQHDAEWSHQVIHLTK